MSIKDDNGCFVMACDDCKLETQNFTMTDLLVNAAMGRWKVFNDPDLGVQHYCQGCGTKTEHELATLLRTQLVASGMRVPEELVPETGDAGGFSLSLDDVVVGQAEERKHNVMPSASVVERKVKEDGQFTFGLDLEDE